MTWLTLKAQESVAPAPSSRLCTPPALPQRHRSPQFERLSWHTRLPSGCFATLFLLTQRSWPCATRDGHPPGSPTAPVHHLVELSSLRAPDRRQRPVGRITERKQQYPGAVSRDAEHSP